MPEEQVATAKTSPLITAGLGCHLRYFLLGGWTTKPAPMVVLPLRTSLGYTVIVIDNHTPSN